MLRFIWDRLHYHIPPEKHIQEYKELWAYSRIRQPTHFPALTSEHYNLGSHDLLAYDREKD